MIRVLNAEPFGFTAAAQRVLESFCAVDSIALDRSELLRCLAPYDALIVRMGLQIDGEVLASGPRLRAIATATTGLDHIDIDEASRRGITVLSLRDEREFLDRIHATAEHTWALLLALLRRLPSALASVRQGIWDRDRFRGHELFERRLGIVGLGRVGTQVAGFGRAFGMEVAAYDPHVSAFPTYVQRCFSLASLLESSDVVTVHVPLDRSTTRLIGNTELHGMPAHAVLVNTSRGEVVDEDALLKALEHGEIAGAALDVLAGERAESRHKGLLSYAAEHDNLLVTPHIGGATHESMARTELMIANKLEAFFRGDT